MIVDGSGLRGAPREPLFISTPTNVYQTQDNYSGIKLATIVSHGRIEYYLGSIVGPDPQVPVHC
jgi:hypothetical protein